MTTLSLVVGRLGETAASAEVGSACKALLPLSPVALPVSSLFSTRLRIDWDSEASGADDARLAAITLVRSGLWVMEA